MLSSTDVNHTATPTTSLAELEAAALVSPEETLAYLELSPRQAFAVAYALIGHCRRAGPPRTALQQEIAGLRDFLLDLLDERQVELLLDSL